MVFFLAVLIAFLSSLIEKPKEELKQEGKSAGEKVKKIEQELTEKKEKLDNAIYVWWQSFLDGYHGIDRDEEIEIEEFDFEHYWKTHEIKKKKIKVKKYQQL